MSPINIIHFPSYYFKALKSNKEFIPCGKGQAYFDAILRNKKTEEVESIKFRVKTTKKIMTLENLKKHTRKSRRCDFYDIGFLRPGMCEIHKKKFKGKIESNIVFSDKSHWFLWTKRNEKLFKIFNGNPEFLNFQYRILLTDFFKKHKMSNESNSGKPAMPLELLEDLEKKEPGLLLLLRAMELIYFIFSFSNIIVMEKTLKIIIVLVFLLFFNGKTASMPLKNGHKLNSKETVKLFKEGTREVMKPYEGLFGTNMMTNMSIDSLELPHYEKYIKVAEKHNGVFLPMSRNLPIFDAVIFDKETGEVIFTLQFKCRTGEGLNSDSLKRYIKKYDGVDGLDIGSLNRDAPNLFSKYYLFNDYKTSGNIFVSNFHKDWIVEEEEVIHKKVEDAVEIIIKNKEWQDKHKDSVLKQIADKFPKLRKDEDVVHENKLDHFNNIKDIDLNNIQKKKIIQTLKEIEINNK